MRVPARATLISIFLIISISSLAKAAEQDFGKDNEWVIFRGPILLDEIDDILSQLQKKEPKLIILNSYGGEVLGALRLAEYYLINIGFQKSLTEI